MSWRNEKADYEHDENEEVEEDEVEEAGYEQDENEEVEEDAVEVTFSTESANPS